MTKVENIPIKSGDRPASTANCGDQEVEISPRAVRAFEEMFDRWLQDCSNLEVLTLGGTGDLTHLCQRAAAWARQFVDSSTP